MGFLFFKTAKEKERAGRREKRHALRRAEGVIDEVVERIKKMEKDADAEWARAKEAAKEGKQAAEQGDAYAKAALKRLGYYGAIDEREYN